MYTNRLKELRKEKNINQSKFAEILGCKQSNVSKYEKGLRKLNADDIIKICKYYNISADYILGLTDEKRKLK